jgi:hypothetical protein
MSAVAQVNLACAEALVARLPTLGYIAARVLPDGSVAATIDLLHTRGLCLGVTADSWSTRFCFEDRSLADRRLAELVSEDDVPAGFVARRGR